MTTLAVRRPSLAGILLLVLVLAGWRVALAGHVYEHDALATDDGCEVCAHAHAKSAGPPAVAVLATPAARRLAPARVAAVHAPTATPRRYQARAPPSLHA